MPSGPSSVSFADTFPRPRGKACRDDSSSAFAPVHPTSRCIPHGGPQVAALQRPTGRTPFRRLHIRFPGSPFPIKSCNLIWSLSVGRGPVPRRSHGFLRIHPGAPGIRVRTARRPTGGRPTASNRAHSIPSPQGDTTTCPQGLISRREASFHVRASEHFTSANADISRRAPRGISPLPLDNPRLCVYNGCIR